METRQGILLAVGIVVGMAVIGGLLAAVGAPDAAYSVFFAPAALVFNPLTLIILLIIFVARRRGHQQQQQQVVVHVGNQAPAGIHVRCPSCKGLNKETARFCGHCGSGLGAS